MRFSTFLYFSTVVASVSAIVIPRRVHHAHQHPHTPSHSNHDNVNVPEQILEGRFDAQQPFGFIQRRSKFFHTGGSSSESSSSSGNSPSGSPGRNSHASDESLGIGRFSSPTHHGAAPASQQAKITFSDSARKHLDDLNLHGKERKKVKTEHVNRIKQEMKTNGATHATVEHLAHAQGSVDPNVHITATFQKAKTAANGGVHKEPIHSSYTDHSTGETVSGTKHHVYTNMVDKTKGAEAMPIHHPTYHQALKNKAADGVAKYRRSYFD
ncbi:hypothetical protein BJ165DRAFT_1523951 [Panaeolus papilionaceus]|nr:hypothetical protein BJ165DRAFT_1523951 [Panaeolus papilionaceus]